MLKKAQSRQTPSKAHEREHLLIGRVAQKNREAFEELYHLYHRRLVSFLLRFTRRPDLVEEALNDTMLAVWQKACEYRHESKPSTWIFGIAYRRALKKLRQLRDEPDELPQDVAAPRDEEPDVLLRTKQIHIALQEALDKLSAEHRAVVELTYFHGYSYPEIATITACSVNTVKTRMFHARRRLRRLLPKLNQDFSSELDGRQP